MRLEDSVGCIKSVGTERTKKFNKLGIFTVLDLIEHFPRDYNDRSNFSKTNEIILNEENTIKGIVSYKPELFLKGSTQIVKAKIKDRKSTRLNSSHL